MATPSEGGRRSTGALLHFWRILRDPEARIQHGQRFLALMEGDSFEAILAAFENHPDGQALLRALPDTEALLADRADLSRRPVGSFGRSYLDFLLPNAFDDADIRNVTKPATVGFSSDPRRMWLRNRIDGSHDVRHVLAGYGGERLGESCLLAFRVGQVRHPGVAALAAAAAVACLFTYGPRALAAMAEAYRRGRAAVLVDLCPFEFNLSEPLESCREKLGLTPPRAYLDLLSARSGPRKIAGSEAHEPSS